MFRFPLLTAAILLTAIAGCGDQGSTRTAPTTQTPAMDIWTAAAQGNVDILKQHAAAGTDMGEVMDAEGIPGSGGTALHIAAVSGQTKAASFLLENGAEVSAMAADQFGGTPLHWATVAGQFEIAELLIKAGADVNGGDRNGATAMDALTVNPSMDAATRLKLVTLFESKGGVARLTAGGNIPLPIAINSIWDAAAAGDVAAIERFLAAGADINGRVPAGFPGAGATPLHITVLTNQGDAAEFLASKGADVNAKAGDVNGSSPLHWATSLGKFEFVKGLIEVGKADINILDNNKATPLDALSFDPTAGQDPTVSVAKPQIKAYLIENGAKAAFELGQ
jgi:ankyrin repeat protein